jgi:hypothetical protein
MTYSKDSSSVKYRMWLRIAVNNSCLFVYAIVPDSKLDMSCISSRLSVVLLSCTSSNNSLAMFNGELYKIEGRLNLKLLISSWKYEQVLSPKKGYVWNIIWNYLGHMVR